MKINAAYLLAALACYGEFTATGFPACEARTSELALRYDECHRVFALGVPVAVFWPGYISYRAFDTFVGGPK
jgi:hypothetical protein